MQVLRNAMAHYARLLTYRKDGWDFSRRRRMMFIDQREDWFRHYLPLDVRGLTVLDVGAGEGETARFFLEQGAEKVLCIEPDRECFRRLKENAAVKPLECYNKPFSRDDLALPFDFMKMDIEGYEEEMLGIPFDRPCVIEIHGLQLRAKFEKAGYQIIDKVRNGWLSYAYENCGQSLREAVN